MAAKALHVMKSLIKVNFQLSLFYSFTVLFYTKDVVVKKTAIQRELQT